MSDSPIQKDDRERLVLYLIHDIEPALASFQSLLGILKKGRFDPNNALHNNLMKSCGTAMIFARGILQDMLEYARLKEGRLKTCAVSFSWDELLQEVIAIPAALAEERSIELIIQNEMTAGKEFLDKGLIQRIALNLVINSIKNSPHRSRVWLRLSPDNEGVVLSIEDEGVGASEEELGRIFEESFQARPREAGQYKGIGLGLSFCREACELIGATISVRRRTTKGLAFDVHIPKVSKGPIISTC
ncbi:MAG: HAMP domain-containing histidine kinase [Candidatus Riflebacteria bacterium]|nr:HAMP domain-containing histidine kinase [Candidatus Riflebacteria bacterium]